MTLALGMIMSGGKYNNYSIDDLIQQTQVSVQPAIS